MRPQVLYVALALLSFTVPIQAESVTYTVTDTASGTIGTQSFTNQNITITFTGDTSNIAVGTPGFYFNTPGMTTINIPSVGTFTVTDPTDFFDSQAASDAGIGDMAIDGSILYTHNGSLSTYIGDASIGPLSGPSYYNSTYDFATTGGVLNFSSAGSTSTFTAITGAAATPEPSSLALLGSGVLALASIMRRRLS